MGEGAVGADVAGGAGDPDEAASGVEHERDGLRRRAKGEWDGVSAIAACEKRDLFGSV